MILSEGIRMGNYNKQSAFTLSELLITMSIIGVIAILTVPNIVRNIFKDSYHSKALAVQENVVKAVRSFIVSERLVDLEDSAIYKDKGSFLNNYLKITKDCTTTGTECFNTTYKISSTETEDLSNLFSADNKYYVIMNTGASLGLLTGGTIPPNQVYAIVDANGKSAPNVFGVDMYMFSILTDGTVSDLKDGIEIAEADPDDYEPDKPKPNDPTPSDPTPSDPTPSDPKPNDPTPNNPDDGGQPVESEPFDYCSYVCGNATVLHRLESSEGGINGNTVTYTYDEQEIVSLCAKENDYVRSAGCSCQKECGRPEGKVQATYYCPYVRQGKPIGEIMHELWFRGTGGTVSYTVPETIYPAGYPRWVSPCTYVKINNVSCCSSPVTTDW